MIEDYDLQLIKRKIKEWITNYIFTTATVSTADSEGCTVTFAGESTPTQKKYKRLASANVASGDMVLLIRLGATFLIIGKIV